MKQTKDFEVITEADVTQIIKDNPELHFQFGGGVARVFAEAINHLITTSENVRISWYRKDDSDLLPHNLENTKCHDHTHEVLHFERPIEPAKVECVHITGGYPNQMMENSWVKYDFCPLCNANLKGDDEDE